MAKATCIYTMHLMLSRREREVLVDGLRRLRESSAVSDSSHKIFKEIANAIATANHIQAINRFIGGGDDD